MTGYSFTHAAAVGDDGEPMHSTTPTPEHNSP